MHIQRELKNKASGLPSSSSKQKDIKTAKGNLMAWSHFDSFLTSHQTAAHRASVGVIEQRNYYSIQSLTSRIIGRAWRTFS
jgi:hypothetical protein